MVLQVLATVIVRHFSVWYPRYSLQYYSATAISTVGTSGTREYSVLSAVDTQVTREYSAVSADCTPGTRHSNTQSFQCLVPQVLTKVVLGQGHFNSWYFRHSRVVSYFSVWYSMYSSAQSYQQSVFKVLTSTGILAVGTQGTHEHSVISSDGTPGTRYSNTTSFQCLTPRVLANVLLGQGHFNSWHFR